MMKPLMTTAEVRRFETILMAQARGGKTLSILEWGSGGSTVYFTEYLRRHGIPYEWLSIEYNRKWHERVSEEVKGDPHTNVVLIDVGNDHVRQRFIPMDEYVAYPTTLGRKFDIIFVDGRKRRRCMIEAHSLLTDHGVAILHDAERRYYWCALATYPRGRFVGERMFVGMRGVASVAEHAAHLSSFPLPWWYMLRTFLWKLKEVTFGRNRFKK